MSSLDSGVLGVIMPLWQISPFFAIWCVCPICGENPEEK
jgi:hypothetical protein